MGQGLVPSSIREGDRREFERRLRKETQILERWFRGGRLERFDTPTFGLEIEGWLLSSTYGPKPLNRDFLRLLDRPDITVELGQYNFEVNATPQILTGPCFSETSARLRSIWEECGRCADILDARPLMIGTLPTMSECMLSPDFMTLEPRYDFLNSQLSEARGQRPVRVMIRGEEDVLELEHDHIMAESAATSVQVHLKVSQDEAVRAYNASLIASAATVAVAANAPYLFDKSLWDDTRIPVFEQAISVQHHLPPEERASLERVTFGAEYLTDSLLDLFWENVTQYPVLLPILTPKKTYVPEELYHLKIQNGVIWRWNRPVIDCHDQTTPHLRIEHRVMSAGPTTTDIVANAAFYLGLVRYLSRLRARAPELDLSFEAARANFYLAARFGLDAQVIWFEEEPRTLRKLLLDDLIPQARLGLEDMGVDEEDIAGMLDNVIAPRVQRNLNGAAWQRRTLERTSDYRELVETYYHNQLTGKPVHEWAI